MRFLLVALLCALSYAQTGPTIDHAKRIHSEGLAKVHRTALRHNHRMPSAYSSPFSHPLLTNNPTLVYPSSFGADPSGKSDSTKALQSALAWCFLNSTDRTMAVGIKDLGGITLDLAGGTYLISAQLLIPMFIGNFHIRGGTFRASANFTTSDHLIKVGDVSCKADGQGSCNEFISFTDIMFHSNFHSAGGAVVQHVMGTTFTNCFWTGFLGTGLQIDGGHEVMVDECWLSQCYWSDLLHCEPLLEQKSIGIQINGPDHYLHNVIIFAFTHIGVEVNSHCVVLDGVHTWNARFGIGIRIAGPANRVTGCYLDSNHLQVDVLDQLVVDSSLFLYVRSHIAASGEDAPGNSIFRDNTYSSVVGPNFVLEGRDYSLTKNLQVDGEVGGKDAILLSTKAIMTQTFQASKGYEFDFGEMLIFPFINHTMYSTTCEGPLMGCKMMALTPSGTKVTIEAIIPNSESIVTVTMEVAQT